MNASAEHRPESGQDRFRRTLIQVLIVQIVALVLLGLLQFAYGG
jgi:hypothetical protein